MCHGWRAASPCWRSSAPAVASAAPGAINAIEDPNLGSVFMDASQANPADNTVNDQRGREGRLQLPGRGTSSHNVERSPPRRACRAAARVTAGATVQGLPIPPIPQYPQEPGWAGECTFTNAGTYDFFCPVHPFMTGTVVVAARVEHATRRSPSAARRPVTSRATPRSPSPRPAPTRTATRSRTRGTSGTARRPPSRTRTTASTRRHLHRQGHRRPTARAARARRRSASRSRSPTARPR